jgi:hypothetical protein
VSEFIAEVYAPRCSDHASRWPAQISGAARTLTSEGTPIALLCSVFVPDDETCLFVFEAQTSEAVQTVARRCDLRIDRLAGAVSTGLAGSGREHGRRSERKLDQ